MRYVVLLAMVLVNSLVIGGEFEKALKEGLKAKECFRIIDSDGIPVCGAKVVATFQSWNSDITSGCCAVSDEKGECCVEGVCNELIKVTVFKDGFYNGYFNKTYLMKDCESRIKDNAWQPYGDWHKIVLKKRCKVGQLTVPDGRYSSIELALPEKNKWFAFDLEKFDFVAPHGRGLYPDMLIRYSGGVKNKYFDYDFTMDICFTNNPCAGMYIGVADNSSLMRWDLKADLEAIYSSQATLQSGTNVGNSIDSEHYMVFRTRTKVDENGNLTFAHYGVIAGPWSACEGKMILIGDACFNQKPNALEIDDGRLLRRNVKHYDDNP